jgi:hypothetical protein
MTSFLILSLWNANRLTQHIEELKTFSSQYNIDAMLISETHFIEKNYLMFSKLFNPPHKRSCWNCNNNNKNHHQTSSAEQPQERFPPRNQHIGGRLKWVLEISITSMLYREKDKKI